MTHRALLLAGLAFGLTGNVARADALFSRPFSAPAGDDDYALDGLSRTVSAKGPLSCPSDGVVNYRGRILPYERPLHIHRAFQARLERFETIVRDLAIRHYGRAPRRIRHLGSLACRRIRGYPEWLSEHALGNALDVAGFAFGPVARAPSFPTLPAHEGLPSAARRALRGSFNVSILDHWPEGSAANSLHAVHSRFLRALATELVNRPDVFRVLLGPAYPGHKNHFHFDVGPYRLIEL